MSDIHRNRIKERLEVIEETRDLYERLSDKDNPAIQTNRIIDHIKKASRQIDGGQFDMYISEGLGLIAAQARAVGEDNIADDATDLLDSFES